jgi:hypothetical protein
LEIDQKAQAEAGSSQIVDALRSVFAAKTVHAFQLDCQHVFDENVSEILADIVALVGDR